MKIVFFGTPKFVDPVLQSLQSNFDVVLSVRQPQEFNSSFVDQLKSLSPDLFVVAAYGQILPKSILDVPKLGTINIHPSILPKYRGASPIQSAILNGDKTTGVTLMKMDEEMDHGAIIDQFKEDILPTDTFESLAERLFALACEKLPEVINNFDGKGKVQDDSQATFTKILKKDDGKIDLANPPEVENLKRMIRAYYPWPGVWFRTDLNGKETVIKLLPEDRIQVEGKNPMSFKDFINGYEKGKTILKSLLLG
jgi:methionyl-tRNA formyltransferase